MRTIKARFTLSIGFPSAQRTEVVEIEVGENATDEQIQEQLDEEWQQWITNYLDGSAEILG